MACAKLVREAGPSLDLSSALRNAGLSARRSALGAESTASAPAPGRGKRQRRITNAAGTICTALSCPTPPARSLASPTSATTRTWPNSTTRPSHRLRHPDRTHHNLVAHAGRQPHRRRPTPRQHGRDPLAGDSSRRGNPARRQLAMPSRGGVQDGNEEVAPSRTSPITSGRLPALLLLASG